MNALRKWTGPLTQDLVLKPGEFGLGQVPARLARLPQTAEDEIAVQDNHFEPAVDTVRHATAGIETRPPRLADDRRVQGGGALGVRVLAEGFPGAHDIRGFLDTGGTAVRLECRWGPGLAMVGAGR